MESSSRRFCLVTPSYAGDLHRFALLRKSIKTFAPGTDHYALVDQEDLPLFRDQFGQDAGLTMVSSAELLPARWERIRRRVRSTSYRWLSRLARPLLLGKFGLRGWHVQQFLKIRFLAQAPAQACMFLDSDLVLCAPLREGELYSEDGKLFLLQAQARTLEEQGFAVSAHLMLGTPVHEHVGQLFAYIHQAPRFRRSTGAALLKHLEALHTGTTWEQRFLQQQWPSEYHLMGDWVRTREAYEGYALRRGTPEDWLYEVRYSGGPKAFHDCLEKCRRERGERGFFLVQSNLRLDQNTYLPRLHQLVDELATP